jgi:hypothetical protein
MKNFLLFLCCVLFCDTAFAQWADIRSRQNAHVQVLSSFLAVGVGDAPAAKTTSGVTLERVIAQSTRDNTLGSLVDSLNLRYTGTHSSTYDYNSMIYPYNYPYSASPMFAFLGIFTTPKVLFDTCMRWTVDPFLNVYGPYELNLSTYDTAKNLVAFRDIFIDSANNDNMSYANVFNTNNNIVKGYWFNLNAGVSDSAFKQYFEYNSSFKLTKDSVYELHLGTWRLASKTNYTYDASNNLTQVDQYANTADTSFLLPLQEQQKYVNTYDASKRLLTVLTSLYSGTALIPSMKDTFAYSGTLAYCNSWREQQFDPINNYWAPIISVQKHITAGLPDTVNTYSFDSLLNSWLPQQMDIMHYDAAHNPDTMRSYLYSWTSFPSTPDYTKVYYYGTYFLDTTHIPPAAIQGPSTAGLEGVIYPNPATNELTIARLDVAPGTTLSTIIVNTAGQTLMREQTKWQGQNRLSIAGLPPATYFLIIQQQDGSVIYRQPFIKE